MKEMKIGIQLYTIREPLQQDFKGVMRELAKLGCDGVEFAWNFGDMEPAEIAAFMKEIGVTTCGMHLFPADLESSDSRMYDYARALGCKYVTFSAGGDFTKIWKEVAEKCSNAGKAAATNGFQFTYHNHAAEFVKVDGEYAQDLILAGTDPNEVKVELDVCWATKAGVNPAEYIKKYTQRLPQLHMKDIKLEDGTLTELGRGDVDLAACVESARESICEWLIYEQDTCAIPQFESAQISIEYLKKLLGR